MTSYPYVRVDLRHRVVSIQLNDLTVVRTRKMDDAHLADIDVDGNVVGIEILTLDDMKLDEMAEAFGFTDHLPAIRAELDKVFSPNTGTTSVMSHPLIVQGTAALDPSDAITTEEPTDSPDIPPKEITLK